MKIAKLLIRFVVGALIGAIGFAVYLYLFDLSRLNDSIHTYLDKFPAINC